MYVSRLLFHTVPGKTGQVEQELRKLREMASAAGGIRARILHAHFASLGAADVVFEQEAPDVAALEQQISQLTSSTDFPDMERTNVSPPYPVAQAGSLYRGRLNMCCEPRTLLSRVILQLVRPDERHTERRPIARLAPSPLPA